MVSRFLIFIFLFSIKIGYTNIIYDKNEISLTEIEINNYMVFYNNKFGTKISNNEAIKNLVLIKGTINYLLDNNPEFMSILDKNIISEFSEEILNDKSQLNLIRFQKIRNEFISEYYENKFNLNDLKIVFSNLNDLKIPLSANKCLIIEKLHKVESDDYFIKKYFENLKNNQNNYQTLIDNKLYDVCVNKKILKKIEIEIIKYIENKTEGDFNNFIYGKIN